MLQYQSFLQPSPLESIHICCIFLDGSNQIIKVERTNKELHIDIEKSLSILSTEVLGEILCGCGVGELGGDRVDGEVSYVVDDIVLYNIDITTEQLQSGVDLVGMGDKFIKSVGVGVGVAGVKSDIIIPQSLSIFHCIQTLYVFVKPCVFHRPKLVKSILKKKVEEGGDSGGGKYRSTKRVRIHPDTFKKVNIPHKTRRVERG